jgi:hypothetical protein
MKNGPSQGFRGTEGGKFAWMVSLCRDIEVTVLCDYPDFQLREELDPAR